MSSDIRAVVYMNWGRWVADCPRPGCSNAEQFGAGARGHVGGLSGQVFRCRSEEGGCGLQCPADWPPNVAEIERLLWSRPVPANRNWKPGEDLADLLAENVLHGVIHEPLAVMGSRILPRELER